MTKEINITEDQLDLMHIIECDSNASQRKISQKTGLSIGKVNYCLKALIDIGFIKIDNFTKSSNKINYTYILTPKGMKEKSAITKQFIIKKKLEYDKLNSYINT
ncbi:MarR family EPS-associated transcriptional regulator [Gammaproteobacteria bacterium]|nr:MarR family EPS-associated transcriptional regulator [Gammaproteobacteria bacterium]